MQVIPSCKNHQVLVLPLIYKLQSNREDYPIFEILSSLDCGPLGFTGHVKDLTQDTLYTTLSIIPLITYWFHIINETSIFIFIFIRSLSLMLKIELVEKLSLNRRSQLRYSNCRKTILLYHFLKYS